MIVVFSLLTVTFFAVPRSLSSAFSRLNPTSSEITVPPVRIAMSSNIAFLLSPKPGALTATTFTTPLILLTTRVASASPSTSSAIINRGLLAFATPSSIGSMSFIFEIFLSKSRTYGSSSSDVIVC